MNIEPNEKPTKASFADKYIAFAEKVSDITGLVAAILLVPLVIVFIYEIAARNIFNSPTTWAYGTCFIIGGCAAVLGFAYAMKSGAMVRIDIVHSRLSEKTICILDLLLYVILFLPLTIGGAYQCFLQAVKSVSLREMISVGSWNAPIWPTKIVMVVSLIVLTMQGIAEMLKLCKRFSLIRKGMKS